MTRESHEYEDIPGHQFSEMERKRLRKLMKEDDNAKFLWSTLRIWIGWGSAVCSGIYLGWDTITKYAHAFLRAATGSGP